MSEAGKTTTVSAVVVAAHTSSQFDPVKINQYFVAVDTLLLSLHKSGVTLPPAVMSIVDRIDATVTTMDNVVDDVAPVVGVFDSNTPEYKQLADELARIVTDVDALQSAAKGAAPAGGEGA